MKNKDLKEVREFLLGYFLQDFLLSPHILDFFKSQYGIESVQHIKEIIEEDDSLIKLIIFPDKSFRDLFYSIAPFCVERKEEEKICLYLKRRINFIKIKIHEEVFKMPLPDNFFCEFLLPIKWTEHIPDVILDIIKGLPFSIRFQILYKLKQSNISWDDNIISFFEMFFVKFQDREDLDVLLENLLCVFTKQSNIEDIKTSLIKRIYSLKQMMSSHVATTSEIDKKGLEFVLTSRIPILDINIEKLQREVSILEEIFATMFPFGTF